MPKVTFYPSGKVGEPIAGVSLLDAAEKVGIELRHDCGGFATCSTCRILILEGVPNLTEIDLDEENMLEEAELSAPFRLSCQAKIQGDVIVRIPDEEMVWSKEAFIELEKHPSLIRQIIRLIVEKKARNKGLTSIVPETAIPLMKEAKVAIDNTSNDPTALSTLLKHVCESDK